MFQVQEKISKKTHNKVMEEERSLKSNSHKLNLNQSKSGPKKKNTLNITEDFKKNIKRVLNNKKNNFKLYNNSKAFSLESETSSGSSNINYCSSFWGDDDYVPEDIQFSQYDLFGPNY